LREITDTDIDELFMQGKILQTSSIDFKCLTGAPQRDIEFNNEHFSTAFLCDLDFKDCIFKNIYFRNTKFIRCRLESVEFRNCNTRELKFNESVLKKINISNAKLFEFDVSHTDVDGIYFDNCEYESCSFVSASLNNVSARNSKSVGLPSHYSKLRNVDEISANFLSTHEFIEY